MVPEIFNKGHRLRHLGLRHVHTDVVVSGYGEVQEPGCNSASLQKAFQEKRFSMLS